MNDAPPLPPSDPPVPPRPSLLARLTGVLAAPGEVFEQIKGEEPRLAHWLIPVVVAALVGVVHTFVIFAQPDIQQRIREQQDAKLQELVDAGKLSQADANAAQARLETLGPLLGRISGSVGAVLVSFVWLFGTGLVLKLGARPVLGQRVAYMKAVEVTGLATMIQVLGAVIQMLLVSLTGDVLVSLGPALLLGELDPKNTLHQVLSSVNLMTLWYVAVLALGWAKVTSGSYWRAFSMLTGLWVVLRALVIYFGWAAQGA